MKIECDVCGQQEATVFCCADEAALCGLCDRSVHHANKLASKHRRFSLLHHPSLSPLCDICQEKKAFVFCQEDRAILCRDCDAPIHAANEHTKKHSRFLLTGVKLSPVPLASDPDNPSPSSSSSSSTSTAADESDAPSTTHIINKKVLTHHQPAPTATTCGKTMESKEEEQLAGSTISDYLIKTLPGWHVEDLLVDAVPSPTVDVLSKMGIGDDLLPFAEGDRAPTPAWWVPQVPQVSSQSLAQLCQGGGGGGGGEMMSFGGGQQRWGGDDVLAVPQMVMSDQQRHQHGSSNRRPRVMW